MPLKEKEILKKRWDGICEKNQSIYDNHVFIEREYMQFSRQDIYPPMVSIMLPRSFVDLPELFARQKYPSEYRPTVIKTSYDLAVNFAFQYFEQKIKEEEIVTATRYYYGTLQKCYPGYGYLECSEHYRDAGKKHVLAWYSYSNPTITDVIYNIHAFTAVEGRLLQCIFNAPENLFNSWKPYVFEIFDSVTSSREQQWGENL